ncbi:MAG: hypothetical protein Q7R52_03050 [archaeon]|nr:hypothetical protein [archaeon]
MVKIKCWVKGKYDSWVKKDGVPITNYGTTRLYPFIQIGKNYSTKTGTYDSYRVMRHGTHTSEVLKEIKTKKEALKFAESYMKKNDRC